MVAKVIKKFSSAPGDDILRFFEIVLFCFVIGNNDMHLKNFSLISEDPKLVVLSPTYDLLSVRLLLSEREDSEELALTLNGKKRKITGSDFLQFATSIGLPPKVSQMVINRQVKARTKMIQMLEKSFLDTELQASLKKIIDCKLSIFSA